MFKSNKYEHVDIMIPFLGYWVYSNSNETINDKEVVIKKHIVITRGDKGALAIIDGKVTECKSKKNLNIVDLTGAGDLFAAGYLHGLINNLNVEECLAKGTELSSVIIQKIGARI